jgi:hypothetical protein
LAIYPIYNPETGEKKVIEMSVHEITDWYNSNKPWIRDWSEGCSSPVGEVGDWRNKTSDGWNDVLRKVGTIPGSKVKPLK